MGFTNFYRHFIHNFSKIVLPLTCLTQKNAPWDWSTNCEQAFSTLKSVFTTALVLAHWDPESWIIVETDASDSALAAILLIYQGEDLHPLAFHSCSFQSVERNYDVHDKELLAIFEAFKRWQHYLKGMSLPVDIFTDHRNLEYFCESKTLTCRQARWSEFLSQFNLKIHFRPDKLGTKPDALTRRWDVYHKGEPGTKGTTDSQNICPLFLPEQLSCKDLKGLAGMKPLL